MCLKVIKLPGLFMNYYYLQMINKQTCMMEHQRGSRSELLISVYSD